MKTIKEKLQLRLLCRIEMNLNMFFNLCWIWSNKTSASNFYKENNFTLCLPKQLLNMFKLWCERGISLKPFVFHGQSNNLFVVCWELSPWITEHHVLGPQQGGKGPWSWQCTKAPDNDDGETRASYFAWSGKSFRRKLSTNFEGHWENYKETLHAAM